MVFKLEWSYNPLILFCLSFFVGVCGFSFVQKKHHGRIDPQKYCTEGI